MGDVFVTAVPAAELMYGVARPLEGRRQLSYSPRLARLLTEELRDKVLPFDGPSAVHYAETVASRERAGWPRSMADAQTDANVATGPRTWLNVAMTRTTWPMIALTRWLVSTVSLRVMAASRSSRASQATPVEIGSNGEGLRAEIG